MQTEIKQQVELFTPTLQVGVPAIDMYNELRNDIAFKIADIWEEMFEAEADGTDVLTIVTEIETRLKEVLSTQVHAWVAFTKMFNLRISAGPGI